MVNSIFWSRKSHGQTARVKFSERRWSFLSRLEQCHLDRSICHLALIHLAARSVEDRATEISRTWMGCINLAAG